MSDGGRLIPDSLAGEMGKFLTRHNPIGSANQEWLKGLKDITLGSIDPGWQFGDVIAQEATPLDHGVMVTHKRDGLYIGVEVQSGYEYQIPIDQISGWRLVEDT